MQLRGAAWNGVGRGPNGNEAGGNPSAMSRVGQCWCQALIKSPELHCAWRHDADQLMKCEFLIGDETQRVERERERTSCHGEAPAIRQPAFPEH